MRRIGIAILLTSAALGACRSPSETGGGTAPDSIRALSRELTASEKLLISASDTFGVALLNALNGTRSSENFFISPLSISTALGMAMNGTAGNTFDEMRRGLGFGTLSQDQINQSYKSLTELLLGLDSHVTFKIANAIWSDQRFATSVEPAFLTTVKQFFNAEARVLDFKSPSAVSTINTWASDQTAGKIKKVLDEIGDEVMFLMNAIYFKGDWRTAFDPKDTQPRPFKLLSGQSINVETMYRKGSVRRGQITGATVVDLPYGGDAFTMTILLPDSTSNVNALIGRLTPDTWRQAQASVQTASNIGLYLPKIKLSWKGEVRPELKTLGMRDMQDPAVADFSKLARGARPGDLYISKVQHDTYVDVNEIGTEAAAVTTVGITPTSLCLTCDIRIDRPYLFAIRERLSGTVLFVGKIVRPELN